MELLQPSARLGPAVDTWLAGSNAVKVKVKRHEIGTSRDRCHLAAEISAPVRWPIPRHEIQELFHFVALHGPSPSIEIKSRAPSPDGWSQGGVALRIGQRRLVVGAA